MSLIEKIPVLRNDVDFSGGLKYHRWAGWAAVVFHALGVLLVFLAFPLGFALTTDGLAYGCAGVMAGSLVFMVGTLFFMSSWSMP